MKDLEEDASSREDGRRLTFESEFFWGPVLRSDPSIRPKHFGARTSADARDHVAPPSQVSQGAQELRRGDRAREGCDQLLPGTSRPAPNTRRPESVAFHCSAGTHTQTQPCTSGRHPCPRAAVASRSFARSRRRRAERVRSGDDDVASGGGARIVHRRRGARAVLHVADAPVIEMNARSASNSTPEHRSEDPDLTPPFPRPYPIQTQSCKRSRLKRFFSPGRACCSDCLKVRARPTRPAPPRPPARPTAHFSLVRWFGPAHLFVR